MEYQAVNDKSKHFKSSNISLFCKYIRTVSEMCVNLKH